MRELGVVWAHIGVVLEAFRAKVGPFLAKSREYRGVCRLHFSG